MLNMKYLILLLIFSSQLFAVEQATKGFADKIEETFIKANRGSFKYPLSNFTKKELNYYTSMKENIRIQDNLASIKYQLINGNLEKAKLMLLQAKYTEDFSRVVQYRYLSIIHFIEGDYKKSLEYLTKKEMYNIGFSKRICLLRTLNFLILNKVSEGRSEWNNCIDSTLTDSPSSHLWMSTLVKLKMNDEPNITDIPFKKINIENEQGNFLRLFLKLALYLNKEEVILDRIALLNDTVFEDPEIRELMGMLYYRSKKIVNSYRFIEDLNSPNAENIKGNIYLTQKKYELAYGQFKLALNKKLNSQNSLERIIPVAWLLKQWDDGVSYIDQLETEPRDLYNKLTARAAFLTQSNRFKEAKDTLNQIVIGSKNSQSPEVNQLYSYTAIMLKDNTDAETYSDKACKNLDGLNCWLQFHLSIWENFALTIHRDEKIINEKDDLLAKYSAGFEKEPLKEDLYINQKDIEELDNKRIKLISNE